MHSNYKKIITGIIISMVLFPIFSVDQTSKKEFLQLSEEDSLLPSDIAGTDLYSESIDVYIAGNKSVIKQSLFSNDTNIIPQFNTKDPAFYKCDVLFSASNGIVPDIFPRLLTEDGFGKQYEMSFNGFSGFLYYDEDLNKNDVEIRANRAFEIIKRKFKIDIIPLNVSSDYFFPFVGSYPDWKVYFNAIIGNLPMDGYWKALDVDRLSSEEYINSNHLSSTFLLMNSLDLFEKDIFESIDQVNFNTESLDLSYLNNLGFGDSLEQLSEILSDFITNETDGGDINLDELFSSFLLSNESHYTSLMFQYEGLDEGIIPIGNDEFEFDLYRALGYEGEHLRPSEKTFIALMGAFMSNIDIKVHCTDILTTNPSYLSLYDFMLEQIGNLLYYANVDLDIEALKDYVFDIFWIDEQGIKRSYVTISNRDDDSDIVNLLPLLGFQGIASIPTGILNPINEFNILYQVQESEPNIFISNDLIGENATYGVYNQFDFNITATNVGNVTAWGIPTNVEPIYSILPFYDGSILDYSFLIMAGPYSEALQERSWEVISVLYPNEYENLEDFFNLNERPRIFYFDSLGAGTYDYFFPNLYNLSNLSPHNERMGAVLDVIASEFGDPGLINDIENIMGNDLEDLKSYFTNDYSIWNVENWRLEPGENISFLYSNFSIDALDSYSEFHEFNFTIKEDFPQLPAIVSGISLNGTDPTMALSNDNTSWIIGSEEIYTDQHKTEIFFIFQNETAIDLLQNSIDQVSIVINFTDPEDVISLEVFNFTSEEYLDISPYLASTLNETYTFSFERNRGSMDWIFDPYSGNNYTILLKLIGQNSESFNISINSLNIELSYRDTNEYFMQGSNVVYGTESGNIQYERTSNSISLSTYHMASIITNANVSRYNSKPGDLMEYSLRLKNVGSDSAFNLKISLIIPGIINDPYNFTINDDSLSFVLSELKPFEEKIIKFTFYIPNSRSIISTELNYTNSDAIQNINSTTLISTPNEIYITAPVDYSIRQPFVDIIEFRITSSVIAPTLGEEFNLSISVKNVGNLADPIPNITIVNNDHVGNLKRIDEVDLIFANIDLNNNKSVSFPVLKEDWKGYYYAPINYISNHGGRPIQIRLSQDLHIGNIELVIEKTVNKRNVNVGDLVRIGLTVRNTGDICIKNITLNDVVSFTRQQFDLIEGTLINSIPCLRPGEIYSVNYTIRGKIQAIINLKPARIDYYFFSEISIFSNEVEIKVNLPFYTQFMIIFLPSIVSIIIIVGFIIYRRKHRRKMYQIRRNELYITGQTASDAILKIDHTLQDYFTQTQNTEINKKGGNENQ